MIPTTQTGNSKSTLKLNQSVSIYLETMHLVSYYTKDKAPVLTEYMDHW